MEEDSVLDYLKSLIDPRRSRIEISGGDKDSRAEPGPQSWPWRSLLSVLLALFAQSVLEPPAREVNLGLLFYGLAVFVLALSYLRGEWQITPIPRVRPLTDSMNVSRNALGIGVLFAIVAFIVLGGNRFTVFNLIVWLLALLVLFRAFWLSKSVQLPWYVRLGRFLNRKNWILNISRESLLFVGVTLFVIFFRFYHLNQVPGEMFSDHAEKLLDVADVLEGDTRIFFPRNTGREAIQIYLTAAVTKYLGTGLSFTSLKIGTVLAGVLTLPFIYMLGREIANRRVGILAIIFAGIAYWPNVISRVALRFNLYPLFAAPTLYFLIRGLRRGNRNDFLWAGLFLGLGLHGYSPFRFVPFVVLIGFGVYLLHHRSHPKLRQTIWHLLVLVVISVIVFLPLLRFVLESPENRNLFSYRMMTRISSTELPLPGPATQIFMENLWRAVSMFGWDNGEIRVHSVTHRPALDVVSAAFFYLGVVVLLIRYVRQRKWEDGFLLLSIPLLVIPSVLSLAFPGENPSLNRTAGAIVPVFIIVALTFDGLLNTLEKNLHSHLGTGVVWGFTALLLLWSSIQNYNLVFEQYHQQFQRSVWNTSEFGSVVRAYVDLVGDKDSLWVIPFPHWVDTRLVGINAGYPSKDYALFRERIGETQEVPGSKLFFINMQDVETLDSLRAFYPHGILQVYTSAVETKDFWIYFVPPRDSFSQQDDQFQPPSDESLLPEDSLDGALYP